MYEAFATLFAAPFLLFVFFIGTVAITVDILDRYGFLGRKD